MIVMGTTREDERIPFENWVYQNWIHGNITDPFILHHLNRCIRFVYW